MKYFLATISLFVLASAVGCSSNEISDLTVATLQAKVERGRSLFLEKNYDAALPVLTEATKSSYVGHEQLVELLLMKARCNLYTGKIDEALTDIEYAEQGAEDLSDIHLVRYEYWRKKGDAAKAEESLQIAQTMNPEIRVPIQ